MKGWRDGGVKGGGVKGLRDGGVEVRKRGMDTIPHYPRRAAGDFANSTWSEAKMRYTLITFL